MFLLGQQEMVVPNLQGPAWAVGIAIVLWAITYVAKTVLELRWSKGSEALIKERAAEVKLKEISLREKELEIDEISAAYEKKIAEIEDRNVIRNKEMQAHIDIIDKKLDASEARERECVKNLAMLEGRLQILESIHKVDKKIDAALANQEVNSAKVDDLAAKINGQ